MHQVTTAVVVGLARVHATNDRGVVHVPGDLRQVLANADARHRGLDFLELAARLYANAARNAPNLAERDHQTRQAARLNQHLQDHR